MEQVKLIDCEKIEGYKELVEEYRYKDIIVPKGFLTDGASIPKYLKWRFDPFDERWKEAAIVHDWLYYRKLKPRKECDEILREIMLLDGAPRRIAFEFYWAVRIGGKSHY